MTKVTNTPVLAFEDKHNIRATTAVVNEFHPVLSRIVDQFNSLEVGNLEMSELKTLIEGPETVIKNKCLALVNDLPSYGPFKVKKDTLMNQLELPDYSKLKASIEHFKKELRRKSVTWDILPMYKIEDKALVINNDALEQRLQGSRTYAVTDREKTIVSLYGAFVKAYKELDEFMKQGGSHPSGLKTYRTESLVKQEMDGELVMNPALYLSLVSGRGV